jgi:uncharacterized protein (TIGR02996 family)
VNDRNALLAAIRANPTDVTVRLVLADWYADTGEVVCEQQCTLPPAPIDIVIRSAGAVIDDGTYEDGCGLEDERGTGVGDGCGYGCG